jgi:hypothetical protein
MICPHCSGKKTLPLNDPRGRREINCPVCGGQGQVSDHLFPEVARKLTPSDFALPPPLAPPPRKYGEGIDYRTVPSPSSDAGKRLAQAMTEQPVTPTVADQKKQGLLQTYAAIVAATRKYVKAKQLGDSLFDTSVMPPSDFYVQSVKSQADAEAAHASMFKLIGELETQEETYAAVKKEEDARASFGQRY